MPGFLRQATAGQSRALGPFVDSTDFKTPKTGLTIANTDIQLVINGAAAASKNAGGGTHRINGDYAVTWDATDTATVGEIAVTVVVATALPVFDKFFVIEEAVFDALFAASAPGYLQPTVAGRQVNIDAANKVAGVALVDLVTLVTTLTTYTGNTPQTGDSFARIGAAGVGLTSVGIAAGGFGATAATAAAMNAFADALLDRNMATGTDSGTNVIRTVRQALRSGRNKVDTGAGTVYKEDDTTASWTFAVTTAVGNPITVVDPT